MAQRTHPHAEATYRVIPTDDGAFAVEVSIPETHPATVSPFATEADAEAWITEHRRRVQYSKPVWPMVSQLRQDELSLLGLKRIGLLSAASAPFAQQPGTPQPPGTPPQPPPDPTAPSPYEDPPRPIPIPRPDQPPVIDDPPPRRNA